ARYNELSDPEIQKVDILGPEGYTMEKIVLTPEHGVALPALLFRPVGRGNDVPRPRAAVVWRSAGTTPRYASSVVRSSRSS
ncbi:hypothetical protein MYX84_01725, partial [Acidobacteria bacterium AH-259-O06]|nr:hypothetical protein [Acidobacteria bacterium AH-259-O06]